MTQHIPILPMSLDELCPEIGDDRDAVLMVSRGAALDVLGGRVVVHVNSTSTGGGGAEMLPTLLGCVRDSVVDARWRVVTGTPELRDHQTPAHPIHGDLGDGGALGQDERAIDEDVLADNAADLLTFAPPPRFRGAP